MNEYIGLDVSLKDTMVSNLSGPARQRGAVLFVSLVFLVLITLLALTAASTSVMQERMTGGLRNGQLALMGSESTARSVEWLIWNKSNNATSNKLHCGATGGDDFCYQASNITGVYGMNFSHMPELHWKYGYALVLAVIAGSCFTLYRRFRRTGWL